MKTTDLPRSTRLGGEVPRSALDSRSFTSCFHHYVLDAGSDDQIERMHELEARLRQARPGRQYEEAREKAEAFAEAVLDGDDPSPDEGSGDEFQDGANGPRSRGSHSGRTGRNTRRPRPASPRGDRNAASGRRRDRSSPSSTRPRSRPPDRPDWWAGYDSAEELRRARGEDAVIRVLRLRQLLKSPHGEYRHLLRVEEAMDALEAQIGPDGPPTAADGTEPAAGSTIDTGRETARRIVRDLDYRHRQRESGGRPSPPTTRSAVDSTDIATAADSGFRMWTSPSFAPEDIEEVTDELERKTDRWFEEKRRERETPPITNNSTAERPAPTSVDLSPVLDLRIYPVEEIISDAMDYVDELKELEDLTHSTPDGLSEEGWVDLCLTIAHIVGNRESRAIKKDQIKARCSTKEAGSAALTKLKTSPAILDIHKPKAVRVNGQWRSGGATEYTPGRGPRQALLDLVEAWREDDDGKDNDRANGGTDDRPEDNPNAQQPPADNPQLPHGALSLGNSPSTDPTNPGSGAANPENGASESMSKNHCGGDSADTDAYLRSQISVPKAVLDVLTDALDDAYGSSEYRSIGQQILAHVYYCQTRLNRYDDVPIGYKLIQKACREAGVPVPDRTADVWMPLEEAGYIHVQDYIHREDDVGRSRLFRVTDSLLSRMTDALDDGYDRKTRYNLVDGKRLRSAYKTQLTYDGEHSWKQRSEVIYETLKALRGQRDLVNKAAVEAHLERLRDARDEAEETYREAVEGSTDKQLVRLARRYERARSRYDQDLRIWSDLVAQGLEKAEDQPEGIYEYETAYEVQEASGRLTQTCGLQNASKAMKTAATKGISGCHNYDIKSSQTEGLKQEMEMAVEMGADIDPSSVSDYVGKDGLAERYGIDRELWKRPEHGGKFGAMFAYDSYEAALGAAKGKVLRRIKDRGGNPRWSLLDRLPHESEKMAWQRAVYNALPTMAQTARDWADDPGIDYDDPEETYEILMDAFEEMTEEIDAWREWLVDEHWLLEGQHGSRFGYFVENPCGLAFSIHDPRLEENGQIDRYTQKAAYATSRLQGLEAAYMHALARIADDYDYEFLRNEHDGAVVLGTIPPEARQRAHEISGFHRARLEEKPFNTEDQTCDTKTSTNRSKPAPSGKPSASRTSLSDAASAAGSADGTTDRSGQSKRKTPSGSAPMSATPSATTSDTTSKTSAVSDSSTDPPSTKPNDSNGSSARTTGNTKSPSDFREAADHR